MNYYALRRLLAKLLHLNLIDLLRASWRRKIVEFSRKSAILADCTTVIMTSEWILPIIMWPGKNPCEEFGSNVTGQKAERSLTYMYILPAFCPATLRCGRAKSWEDFFVMWPGKKLGGILMWPGKKLGGIWKSGFGFLSSNFFCGALCGAICKAKPCKL